MEATQEEMKFILKARRTEKGKEAGVPAQPKNMPELIGSYPKVSEEAVRLNDLSNQTEFYLFYPEAYPENTRNTHCNVCMQITANELLEED